MFIGDTSASSKASSLPFIEMAKFFNSHALLIWTHRKHPESDRNPLSVCADYVQVRLSLRGCEHLIYITVANIRRVH